MGPNGQAQYFADDLAEACRILLRHYEYAYVDPGERFPRPAVTDDPIDRDVSDAPHGGEFATVGEVFSENDKPGRQAAVRDAQRHGGGRRSGPRPRWSAGTGCRTPRSPSSGMPISEAVPVSLIGFESKPMPRLGCRARRRSATMDLGHAVPAVVEEDRARHQRRERQPPARRARQPVRLRRLARVDAAVAARVRRRDRPSHRQLRRTASCSASCRATTAERSWSSRQTLHDNMEVAALEGSRAR